VPDPIHDLIIDAFAATAGPDPDDAQDPHAIDSEAQADRALQLRAEIEGRRAGDLAMLAAVTRNIEAKIAQHDRELADWDWKFKNRLEDFARARLAGKDSRTLRLTWGCVSFRKTPGKNKIIDMDAAVAWVKAFWPERVKVVETVGIEDVLETLSPKDRAKTLAGKGPLPWLESTGAGEACKISTGVETEKGKP
jgi:hypothetical protein